MTEQWQELKETIIEMRDNDGTGTQQEVCKFLVNLMDVLEIEPDRITVYHMFDEPRNCNPKIINKVGGFKSDDERDEAMTKNSSFDIAFVRDNNIITGTGKNILRRNLLDIL